MPHYAAMLLLIIISLLFHAAIAAIIIDAIMPFHILFHAFIIAAAAISPLLTPLSIFSLFSILFHAIIMPLLFSFHFRAAFRR
jgi:hypothetical protein